MITDYADIADAEVVGKVSRCLPAAAGSVLECGGLTPLFQNHQRELDGKIFTSSDEFLRDNEFAYRGMLLGREVAKAAPM